MILSHIVTCSHSLSHSLEHDDLVAGPDCGQPMGDKYGGPALSKLIQGGDDLGLWNISVEGVEDKI